MQGKSSSCSVQGRTNIEDIVIKSEIGRLSMATRSQQFNLAGHSVDGLRKALDIARRYPSYGYSAVFGGVYRVLSCVSTVIVSLVQLQLTSLASLSICSGFNPV